MPDVPFEQRRGPSKWTIEAALLLVQFGMGLGFLSPAPLFPLIIDEYDVSRAAASLLVGGTSLGVALALVPASILPARIGTRWAVTLGGALLASMLLTPLANSFVALLVLRILFSLGAAVLLSALPAVVVRWFEPRELALVNGLGIVAQTLGVATSMSVAASVAAVVGWHLTLTLFAAVVGTATVVWVVMSAGAASDAAGAGALSMRDNREAEYERPAHITRGAHEQRHHEPAEVPRPEDHRNRDASARRPDTSGLHRNRHHHRNEDRGRHAEDREARQQHRIRGAEEATDAGDRHQQPGQQQERLATRKAHRQHGAQ